MKTTSTFSFLLLFGLSQFLSSCVMDVDIFDLFNVQKVGVDTPEAVEEGTSLFVNFEIPPGGKGVKVDYVIEHLTTSEDDFSDAIVGSWEIGERQASSSFELPVALDGVYENVENFKIKFTISHDLNDQTLELEKNVQIINRDPIPQITLADVSVNEGAGSVDLNFSFSETTTLDVSFNVKTVEGSAGALDYTAIDEDVVIPVGSNSHTITLILLDDALDEIDETLNIEVSHFANAAIDSLGSPQVTILDDDNPPDLTISDLSVIEGDSGIVTVSLSSPSGKDISVDYLTVDGTASSGTDYTSLSNTLTILSGDTSADINITSIDDSMFEGNESFNLNLSNPIDVNIVDNQSDILVVENDGPPTLVINDISFDEGVGVANFTVSLSSVSGVDVSFDWASANSSALAGSDYVAASGSETITAGNTSMSLSITINDDVLDELDEAFEINLSNPTNATISDGQGIGTIEDNDATPSLSISDVTVNESDSTADFTVTLSAASGLDVSFDWTSADATATAGSDYTAGSNTSETITAGGTTATITINLVADDAIDELDETFELNLSNPSNATIADAQGIGTITDNDATPTLSIANVSAAEDSNQTFTVTLSAASGLDVDFDYATSDGTAIAGTDYTAASGSLTISAGSTTQTFTVTVADDALDEADETYTATISNPVNATITTASGTGTIADNDATPSLSIDDMTVNESDSTVDFTVTLSAVSGQDVSFDWASADVTATAGSDYTAGSNISETISEGNTTATITVSLLADDVIDELDETFELNLSNPSNATIADAQGIGTITDNDATPTLSIANVSAAEDSNQTFTVTLSAASGLDVDFDYATSNGTAVAGSDYTAASGSLTISAGSTTQTFTVTVADDALDEADETYTATISNPVNATITTASATGTITDNDATPSLSIDDVTVNESDSTVDFTVTLSAASGLDVSFDWASADATATAGSDYTAGSNTSETISAGSTTATLTINLAADDAIDEVDETFELNLSNPSNATISDAQGIGTITDNDATPTLSIANVTAAEDSNQTFTVTLSAASGLDVDFDYATSNGTATAGSDYTAASGSLTISAGSTTQTFTVTVADDALDEADETYTATISNPVNATIATASGTGTITDNDATPSLSIDDVTVNESDSTVDFTVTLSAVSGQDVSFDWASADATATAGSDYTAGSNTSETISAGSTTTTLTINLPADDAIDELDETFELNLSNPSNATISDAQGIGTITDNDATPTLSIANVTAAEDSNQTFTVTLSAASGLDVDFDYATSNGTAVAGNDYTAASGNLTISAGSTTQTFTVTVADDALDEADETYTATISNPVNATIATASGTGTITDNDVTPSLSIDDVTVNEFDSTVDFTVTLSAASGLDVNFDWASADATATAGSDYTAGSNTSETISAGSTTATVTINLAADDAIDEVDETFELNLSNPSNATIADAQGIGTITDNDATPTLSITNVTAAEDSNQTFTVTLSAASGLDVDFDYATSDGTAIAGTDYTAASGSLTISAGSTTQTFTVTVADDALDEADETYTATISNPVNATITTASGTGTITDNDATPSLSIDDVTVNESDSTVDFTVTLSAASGLDVNFDWASADATATAGSDYTAGSNTSETISAGSTTATITINLPADDAIDEVDETFELNLSNPSNATISDAQGIGTITDNDATPTLSIANVSAAEDSNQTFIVTLSAASGLDVDFDYATSNGTAVAGSDYTAASGSLTISAGSTTQTFTVTVADDVLSESSETYTATISNPVNATIVTAGATGTIIDNDAAPTISIDDVTVNESDSTVDFTVSLSSVSGLDVSFDWASADATATAGSDYTAGSNTSETITAGNTTTTLTINLAADDAIDEIDETFELNLSNPSNATISDAQGIGTITDNDATPTLSIANVSAAEDSNQTFTVTLSAASGLDVDFDYATSNGTAVAGSDYTATSGSLTISAGSTTQTFTVTVADDALDESDETYTATISNPVNAAIALPSATGTITDNDATPSLSIDDVTVNESDSTVDFTVTLSAASGLDVSFDWASADATATAGSDYTAGSNTSETISAGSTTATITINLPADDAIDEVDETFELNLSNPSNATIADAQGIGTITDNDATPTLSIANVSAAEDSNQTFTVTLSAASGLDVDFDYATSDGTAISGTDYTAASGSLTISAGSTTQTFTVTVADDALDEADETYTATISNPVNATIATASGTGTITDNDATPSLSIDDVTVNESDSTVDFTVTLSAASGLDVSFDWASADATATAGSDYTAGSNTSETISAGSATTTLTINLPADDAIDELDETFELNLSNPSNATISDAQGIGTITDNDATPTLSIANVSAAEDSNQTFTVTLSAASGLDVDFDYATSNGTATAGSDYMAASGSLTISAGSTTQTFTVTVSDDALDEADETYTATISNPVNATITTASGTGTVTDNDSTPSLSIDDVTVNESASTVDFTVTLSAASGLDVSFDWASADATATAGSDYTAGSNTSETISAGSTTATLTINLAADDAIDEANETFELNLSNPSNATIADAQGIGTITDNDATPTLSIANVSAAEDSNQTFTVTLSAASGLDVDFDYATSNGTATAGSDYTAASGSLTISAGSTTQTFTVTVADDALDEVDETYTATISNPVNATITTASGTGTITDNDATPTLSIANVSAAEDSNQTFTVTLSAASGLDVDFDYATSDGTATAGSDYTAASGSLTISAGSTTQTFTVTVADDALNEVDETYTATISNPVNAAISLPSATGTITDNDATPSLSIDDVTVNESDSTVDFTVTLSAASGLDINFDWASADATATAGSDYTAGSNTSETISAGSTTATLTINLAADDAIDEIDETFELNLSNPSNATIADAQGIGTITDNDATPTLSIANVSATEDSNQTFTVTLSAASGLDVDFDYATSNGTATAGSDYTAASGSLTISAGSTTQTFTVTIADDALDEADETYTATISNPANATIATASGTGTITDNDATPSLSIDDVTVNESDSTVDFTVTLSAVSGQNVSFDWASADATATAGSDYTAGSNTSETISAGSTTATVTINLAADDAIDEVDETFELNLSNPSNATISDAQGIGTITDNDATPTLSIANVTAAEDSNQTFTVTLSAASGLDVDFDYATSNGTATAGSDYTAASGSLTISAGSTTQTFTVTVADDALSEPSETYTATISNPVNATITTAGATGTITDNDGVPSLSIDDVTVNESDSTVDFTVTLSAASGLDVSFDWASADATATAGSDYTAGSNTSETITAGNTTTTITINLAADDAIDEVDETFELNLSNPSNATIADAQGIGTITDNDATPTLSIANVSAAEDSNQTFTVTLSAASGLDVDFDYATSNGTAVAGSDYTAASGSLTISAGSTTQTFTVTVADDALDEADETYTATISNPVNATITTASGTGTITDNDATPSLSIDDVTVNESDSTVDFTVTLSAASGLDVNFDWASADATATAGSDYTAGSNTSETISAGSTTATITINLAADDAIDEIDETFELNLSNPSNATIADAQGIGTITDNDATPTLSIANVSAAEDSNQTFTVTLSAASGLDVDFDYATSNGTAVAGSDYTAASGSLTISAGSTTQTFTVTVADDALDEADETYTATISNPVNATIATASGTGTITDNDVTPSLSIDDVTVNESDSTVDFTVTLSAASGLDVNFDWASADATATAGSDYTAGSNTSETISAGSTTATITINLPADDAIDEVDETFELNLSNPSNATIADAQGIGTITDNDATPTLSIANVTAAEDSNQTFTVTLSAASGLDVDFDYATSNGTAVAGSDYTTASGSLTISAGSTTQTFTVTVADDALDESDETYTATISNPVNAAISLPSATGTITDNDATPSLSIDDVTVNESDSTVDFTVTLSSASGLDVSFDWASADATATAGSDYTAGSNTSETISAGSTTATITINLAADDAIDEVNETFELNLSNPSNATIADAQGIGTITDNDGTPSLSINDVTVNESASTVDFTVTLSAASGLDVNFDWASADATATAGSDYTAGSNTSETISAGSTTATITINLAADDAIDEINETFELNLSNPSNATIADAQGIGTITDNDATPTLSIANVTAAEDSNQTFTVTLSAASGLDVDFDYATSNGTAVAGSDYTAASGSLTISAGSTTQTFTVTVADDALDEADETYTATISNPVNATITTASGTGTITDNDATPTLSIANVSAAEDSNQTFTVTLSAASGLDVDFDYATSNGTATAGSDYTAASGSLTISAGSTTQTFTVTVSDDALDEADETYTATISNPVNATITTASGTGTITDNDSTPSLSIDDVTVNESDSTVDFTVTLSAASGLDVNFDWASADATATAGSDYTAGSNTSETISAGSTTATLTINLAADDAIDEANETFELNLSSPSNATIADAQGIGTITDNDATPTLSIANVSAAEDSSQTFTVTLSAASGLDVDFDYATSNGTAVAGSDYTAASGSLTISAGSTTQTFTVTVADDALDEADETYTATISNPVNATITTASGTGTITDNDATPTLSISDESEVESSSQTFTVTLSAVSGQDVTFDFATGDGPDSGRMPASTNGTAVAGSDYTANSGSLTITAGSTTQTITVAVLEDSLDEDDEDFTVTLSNPTNATLDTSVGEGTITDNDATPTLSIANVSAAEDSNQTFTVTLSAVSGRDVDFDYATSNGTAVAGSDYTAASGSLTISAGSTTQTFTVTVSDDALDEADETYTATISNPVNATITTASATGTITDNDATPSLSISDESETEGTNQTFTVTLSAVSGRDVTFDWNTADDTAVAGTDYTAVSTTSVTISEGSTTATLTVNTASNTVDEGDRDFEVQLSNPGNATISDSLGVGTIQDDDSVFLQVNNITISESANAVLTVSTVGGVTSANDVTFKHFTPNAGNTATMNVDFNEIAIASAPTSTITAGNTSTTISVTVNQDTIDENQEYFGVMIFAATNATISDSTGDVLINDDDSEPTLSISPGSATEGSPITYTINLSNASQKGVSFDWQTIAGGTATATTDYTTVSTTNVSVTNGTTSHDVTVNTATDTLDEANETVRIQVDNQVNAVVSTLTGDGTINDDDATPSLSIDDVSVAESGSSLSFTVSLSAVSGQNVSFNWATADDTATAGADYTANSGTGTTITAGSTSTTLTVNLLADDSLDEVDETFDINLTTPTNATISDSQGVGTITDNDAAPSLSINDVSVAESAANIVFTVSLSAVSGKAVSFDWASSDDTATAGSDYTAGSGTGTTISAGSSSTTITITLGADDSVIEPDETFDIDLSNPTNATISDSQGVGTITNNDVDTTPPAVVTGFSSERFWPNFTTSPHLTWNANGEGDFSHYEIEMRFDDDNSSIVAWTNIGAVTTYQFTGLSTGIEESYYANIRAVDTNGNASASVRVDAEGDDVWTYFDPAPVVEVAAGQHFACALASRAVKCWGEGSLGQLGDGNSTDSSVPEPISSINKGVIRITAGNNHACAVQSGAAYCWGSGSDGQLGNGSTSNQSSPVAVTNASAGVTDISAGNGHTCAVVNGGAKCWGVEFNGRLGNGNGGGGKQLSAVDVTGLTSGVQAVVSGWEHSCALVDGGVKCWGANWNGQLGDGTTNQSYTPVDVSGLTSGVQQIVAGRYHTCALTNGGVKCWGRGTEGQLGNGNTVDQTSPVDVTGLTSGVQKLARGSATNYFSCAIVDGDVKCWGEGNTYQLGNGLTSDSSVPVSFASVNGSVSSVALGGEFTCLVVDGAVQCLGRGTSGQLGDNNSSTSSTLVFPFQLGASGVQKMAVGQATTCMIYRGAAYCWGLNDEGQVGDGTQTQRTSPTKVVGLDSGVEDIMVGDYHSCALVNGGVKCWGANWDGQIGDSSNTQRLTPVDVTGLTSGVQKISVTGYHSCALKNGGLKCWGWNGDGELGDGTTTSSNTPVDVVGMTSDIQDFSAGGDFTCASKNGQLKCWGANNWGQIGNGTTTTRELSPTNVSGISSGVLKVSLGHESHACALVDGGVKCWGRGTHGQLGDGLQTTSNSPVVAMSSNAFDLKSGRYHTCALQDNRSWCWGYNGHGEIGDGTFTTRTSPTKITSISYPTDLSQSFESTCFIWNASPYCWGRNNEYELGDGTNTDRTTPVLVDLSDL